MTERAIYTRASASEDLNCRKKESANIAEDLCYGKEVIKQIWRAQTTEEINRILRDARLRER